MVRQCLMSCVIIVAYWSGLDAVFYWLNRKSKRIITFHNVVDASILPLGERGLICFSDEIFSRIIQVIAKRFAFSVDCFDPTTCTLTFDDGYLNQLEVAGRILRRMNIPAILFLAGDLLNSSEPLMVDQCLVWSTYVPMEVADRHWGRHFVDRTDLWQSAVRPMFAADGVHRGRESLEKLDAIFPLEKCFSNYTDAYRRLRFTGVTSSLLDEFKKEGWVFAHHTNSHFPVKDLSFDDARKEMAPPEGMENFVFSFPYGDEGSVSIRDVKLVEELGYPCAVSNEVEQTSLAGRFFLPRFMLTSDDKYMIHFQLSGLKYFLKYKKLLPRLA